MLFNPGILLSNPWIVAATLAIVLFANPLLALSIALAFRHPLTTAFTLAASLAQIGEFSFILAGLGVDLRILPAEGRDLILAGAILSILANPFVFAALDRLKPWLQRREASAATPPTPEPAPENLPVSALKDHAVVIGYGRVGSIIVERLQRDGRPFLVIEDRQELVGPLRASGVEVIVGNAADMRLLKAANLRDARWLFVAIPDGFEAGTVVEQARWANPRLQIIARAHFDAEVEHLQKHGANLVIMGEREIALGMLDHALGAGPQAT
jgi:CPA2 family monovalent cation:H+ antiporter-2